MKMNQPGTDRGKTMKHGDMSGETGEKLPKAKASDGGGERRERLVAGVALGKKDGIPHRDGNHLGKHEGLVGEHNEGRKEGVVYNHTRSEYHGEDRGMGQKI